MTDRAKAHARRRQLASERGKAHWDLVVRLGACTGIKPHIVQRFWSTIQHLNECVLSGDQDAVLKFQQLIARCLRPIREPADEPMPKRRSRRVAQDRNEKAVSIMRWAVRTIGSLSEARRAFDVIVEENQP